MRISAAGQWMAALGAGGSARGMRSAFSPAPRPMTWVLVVLTSPIRCCVI